MSEKLILASASPFRKMLLSNAGLSFDSIPADIDERVVEASLPPEKSTPQEIALSLARAKALDVSAKREEAFVIGSDQVMSMGGTLFHKCKSLAEARQRLLEMSGQDHFLDSAIAVSRGGEVLWEHVSRATMSFRKLDESEIDRYLLEAGEAVLGSVGVYQFEGLGIRLFEKIDGDYFTIIGLPMLPLLAALRNLEVIDA